MELRSVELSKSPDRAGRVQVKGLVRYDGPSIGSATQEVAEETYWFEVDEGCEPDVNGTGDMWLACLLPLAVTLGEPLRLSQPVDASLYENVQELMLIWDSWYSDIRPVAVEAETVRRAASSGGRRACFFSGGVDSFFTVLRNDPKRDPAVRTSIDELVVVRGFDVPVHRPAEFAALLERLRAAARDLGKNLVDVSTNLRATRFVEADWGRLSHTGALSSIAHLLRRRYGSVVIPSSYSYRHLIPWASHPLTDPLWSSSQTRIIHDGAAYDRIQKTVYLADSEVASRSLHVCWVARNDQNCCECAKCYRTMATLEVVGSLERFSTFHTAPFCVERLAKVRLAPWEVPANIDPLIPLAEKSGRLDIADALARSARLSARLDRWLPKVWRLRRVRALVPVADIVEEAMLRDVILE